MKKYVVGLAIASAFSLVAVSLFVYFVIQTIALAFFVDPLTTSFPWYGYCPTMLFLALIAVPMILVVAFSVSAIRKSRLTHSPVQNANKGIFWSSIALMVALFAVYVLYATLYAFDIHVWIAKIGTDRGLLLLTVIIVALAVFPAWNCFTFSLFHKEKHQK